MKRFVPFFLLTGLLALSACAGGPRDSFPFIRLAPSAPPQELQEPAPDNAQPETKIWRPGYWTYDGKAFNWVSGQFIDRPAPTAVWSADRWDQHDYGWAYIPGYWQ